MSHKTSVTTHRPARIAIFARRFSVRNSRFLEFTYQIFSKGLIAFGALLVKTFGARLLRPLLLCLEVPSKKTLFDCQMCGQCVLSSTGMSCPTNCPKSIRNGPCGGVRANGHCEIKPDMPCVWVQAWNGAQKMTNNQTLRQRLEPIDHRLWGASSWFAVVEHKGSNKHFAKSPKKPAGEADA